jgi:hypothetical protein
VLPLIFPQAPVAQDEAHRLNDLTATQPGQRPAGDEQRLVGVVVRDAPSAAQYSRHRARDAASATASQIESGWPLPLRSTNSMRCRSRGVRFSSSSRRSLAAIRHLVLSSVVALSSPGGAIAGPSDGRPERA